MPTPPLDDDLLIEVVDAVKEHGSQKAAAKALDLPRSTLRHRLRLAASRGYGPDYGLRKMYPDGFRMGKTTIQRDACGNIERTWERMVEDRKRMFELAEHMISEMAQDIPRATPTPKPRRSNAFHRQLLTLLPWGDPHFGMYAWAEETGDNFDLNIAKRDLCNAVRYLVRSTPKTPRCVIANLGDFFHADNLEGTTARSGNILDMDSRLPKMVRVGVSAMRVAIHEALRRHEVVEVVNVPGNHDPVLGFVFSILLANVYENEPRVVIHERPTFRHYIRHGKVLLGFVHGDKTKDKDLPGIMAAERPEEWGNTRFRFFYRGHHHHDRVQEYNGCTVVQVRTLAANDSYATSHGFLSDRDMRAVLFHEDFGKVTETFCSIELLRALEVG